MPRRLLTLIFVALTVTNIFGQVNTDQVLRVGRNALYFEDYMLSIQHFNRAIEAKPYLAQPYFYRAIAKLNLEDYTGAEADAAKAIELNPYLTDAWEVRGVARQNLGDNDGAIADYTHALELLPHNRQLLFNKALAQSDIKHYHEADSTFAVLLTHYPGFESGYLGRARLNVARGDTVGALADIDQALSINPKAANAYIMRADIAIARNIDDPQAIADMDEAIRLMPHTAGLYINRAYLRYRALDYFGAMADFDYALELDPLNSTALTNRSLLLMETGSYDRAIGDLDRLLQLNPNSASARYNRALAHKAKGEYTDALADINVLIAAAPDLPENYYVRASIERAMGSYAKADTDARRAGALARKVTESSGGSFSEAADPEAEAARHFSALLTVEDNAEMQEEYNNSAIRGKVQDRNLQIEPEGWLDLTYYPTDGELRNSTYYIREIDDINATRILPRPIAVSVSADKPDAEATTAHRKSIDYFNSYISTHTPRPIDYIARGMDFMSLADYAAADHDFDRAIELAPALAAAHLLKAQALFRQWETQRALAELNTVTDLSPRMAEAWYDKGVIYLNLGDLTSALAAFNRAIDLKPNLGEAWYNRGYIYLRLGNERSGIADLSRAGQLGILPAYNLIKRISK